MSEPKKFIDLQFCQFHIKWFIFTSEPQFPSLTISNFGTLWNTDLLYEHNW